MKDKKLVLTIVSIVIAALAFVFGEGIIWRVLSINSDPLSTNASSLEDVANNSTTSVLPETASPTTDGVTAQPTASPSDSNFDTNENNSAGTSDIADVENISSPVPSEMIAVPNVIGMEQEAAIDLLLSSGFAEVSISGKDVITEHYYIFGQSIPANTSVPKGATIELTRITKKPGTFVVVPKVVGMEQQEATTLIIESGLQFHVWWMEENNTSFEYDYIIDQSIPADSSVPAGTLIRLELSSTKP